MDFYHFNSWTRENFSFDCFAYPLFEQALYESFGIFSRTQLNGVSFVEIYKDNLFETFLPRYKRHLELLIKQIQPVGSHQLLNSVYGVRLTDYQEIREELLCAVDRLNGQCLQ